MVMSFRCGTFPTPTGSSASSAAARIGSVAFFAPEMRTSPSRGTPPWICNLSISVPAGLVGRQRLDRQRVDLASHVRAERAVDELVTGDRALSGELARDDVRGKVGVVVGLHPHLGPGQACADEPRNFF